LDKKVLHAPYFLSCDWGTSSFRLYLVDAGSKEVIQHVSSQFGIKRIHAEWDLKRSQYHNKQEYFLAILRDHIMLLEQKSNINTGQCIIVASGMISSSIGLKNLPYANLPFDILGHQVVTDIIEPGEHLDHPLLLISGVCSADDVMRGEETQSIGLAASQKVQDGLFIFPGTHSKHVAIEDGIMTGFKTYMTGEVFDVMSRHSILSESLSGPAELLEKSFDEGLQSGFSNNLLHSLFSVRGKSLLQERDKSEHRNFLSGLLIGYEISGIDARGKKIFLCGGEVLEQYYSIALYKRFSSDKINVISSHVVNNLAVKGHGIILHRIKEKL